MLHQLFITLIISDQHSFFHLKGLQNWTAHALTLTGIDDGKTILKVNFVDLLGDNSDVFYFAEILDTRFVVFLVDDGASNQNIHAELVY